jgi:hypothetical protein
MVHGVVPRGIYLGVYVAFTFYSWFPGPFVCTAICFESGFSAVFLICQFLVPSQRFFYLFILCVVHSFSMMGAVAALFFVSLVCSVLLSLSPCHPSQLHDLYSSLNMIWNIKSIRRTCAGHVAHMGEKRNVYSVLVGKPQINKTDMCRACGTFGGEEICIQCFGGETRWKDTTWKT